MKHPFKYSSISCCALVALLIFIGCSRKKDTFTSRSYHNTTARYNAYFNGREITKEALQTLKDAHEDDYSEILHLFITGDEETSKSIYPQMDDVIKKCSKVIERHTMYIKKKERVRWIDDSYMLIGKARYYKNEYFGALEIFEYVERAFRDEPVRVSALTWIARTHMELDNEVKTELTLEKIEKIRNLPEEFKSDYYAVHAEYLIRQERFEEAIEKLEKAIQFTKSRKIRRRYIYVLAQLYHNQEDYTKASQYYEEVIKLKPDYVMDFNARINKAKAYDVASNNSDQIKKDLNKMLRDRKNAEFYDQVYFALAELAFIEKEDSLGITYLQKSAESSVNNTKQKSRAYLKLGHIYYDRPDYVKAQAYYDSTSGILENSHPDYQLVIYRNEGLTRLVKNLRIVENEDSLQRMAGMDEKEREKIINKIIKEVEYQEDQRRQELENSFDQNFGADNNVPGGGARTGKWYFYNPTTKSLGVTEFYSTWGNRKLEDNWRRSNKRISGFANTETVSTTSDTSNNGFTNKDVEFYLNKLPLTDSAMSASHNRIIEAMYEIGGIYKESFEDFEKSIEGFEALIKRYDTCRYVLSSYYQLYRTNLLIEEYKKAEHYKQLILKEYPFSEYARIIKNPSYAKQRRDRKDKIEAYYKATYQLYDYDQYNDVISSCENSDSLFGESHLKPKFDLLKSLAIGKRDGKEAFRQALVDVTINHPDDSVALRAEEIIARLDGKVSTVEEDEKEDKPKAVYSQAPSSQHVFVLIIPGDEKNADKLKISVSNFNGASFGTAKLSLNTVILQKNDQLLSVRNFKNKTAGMNYYKAFKVDSKYLRELNTKEYASFIISSANFAIFYKDKDVENYLDFFKKNYL